MYLTAISDFHPSTSSQPRHLSTPLISLSSAVRASSSNISSILSIERGNDNQIFSLITRIPRSPSRLIAPSTSSLIHSSRSSMTRKPVFAVARRSSSASRSSRRTSLVERYAT